jgi:hypothetical protein
MPFLFWGRYKPISKHNPRKYQVIEGNGSFTQDVVGESRFQNNLYKICGGKTREGHRKVCVACLLPEPKNRHDANAIAVYIENRRVGYIPIEDSCRASEFLNHKPATAYAIILGGWRRSFFNRGHFGVKLDIDLGNDDS